MLRFQFKPDAIFSEILSQSLADAIAALGLDIEAGCPEDEFRFADVYFEDEIVQAFGGGLAGTRAIRGELERLLAAHASESLYMPTDYHFKLLDRVITAWCDIYNDALEDLDEKDILRYHGKAFKLDADFIIDSFFWDTDYDLPQHAAAVLRAQDPGDPDSERALSGVFDSAINASLQSSPDTIDLQLEEWMPDPEWLEDCETQWVDEIDEEEIDEGRPVPPGTGDAERNDPVPF